MNHIQNFDFEGNLFRVIVIDGAPWFVATDICRSLAIKNSRDAVAKLDDDEKGVGLTDTLGGQQRALIVSEGGMFALILSSRKAFTPGTVQHRFRKWVTGELLPTLRRTGRYVMPGAEGAPAPTAPVVDVDAPLEARVGAVRLAERLYGRAAARQAWEQLRLPAITPRPAAEPEHDAEACLAHLLNHDTGNGLIADLIAARDERALLEIGIRLEGEGIWIANAHRTMRRIMTEFPRFWRLLAALPGARVKTMKFGAWTSRATFVTVPV